MSKIIYSSDDIFIEESKKIVHKLIEAQSSRKIPGGIVVIFDGSVGYNNRRYCSIIKAEIHSGFRKIVDKKSGLAMDYVSDLLLTPQQKLYKIGVFIHDKDSGPVTNPSEILAYVYDYNMTAMETRQIAIYFYETFLGCIISPTDKKLTQDFYLFTKQFIDEAEIDDDEKVDLNYGLYTYLKIDRGGTVKTTEFADRFFNNDELKENYQKFMREKKFPGRAITKDLTYLKNKLRRRSMFFTSNIKITGPAESFSENVKIVNQDDDKTVLSISGKIKAQE